MLKKTKQNKVRSQPQSPLEIPVLSSGLIYKAVESSKHEAVLQPNSPNAALTYSIGRENSRLLLKMK